MLNKVFFCSESKTGFILVQAEEMSILATTFHIFRDV